MATTIVVRYDPPGNFGGQYLAQVGNLISAGKLLLFHIFVLKGIFYSFLDLHVFDIDTLFILIETTSISSL